MDNGHKNGNRVLFGLLCASLAMIPGCWWNPFKKQIDEPAIEHELASNDELLKQGEQLVCMNGVCIISEKSLDRDFEQLLEENPQLRSMVLLIPNAKENLLQGMISQIVVDRAVKENKMHLSADYKKEYATMMKSVERMLNTKYFSAAYTVEITDFDVKKYYEDNKTQMPDLVVSNGGVKAEGVSFETEEAAKTFATAVKGKDFAKIAKEQKLDSKIQDFKLINEQSIGVNPRVKGVVLAMKTFPTTEIVKADEKTFWVIRATEKQEPKYRPLEQVHAGLKQYIEKERRMTVLEREITRLRQEYNVTINETFFAKQKEQQKLASVAQMHEVRQAEASDVFDHIEPTSLNIA